MAGIGTKPSMIKAPVPNKPQLPQIDLSFQLPEVPQAQEQAAPPQEASQPSMEDLYAQAMSGQQGEKAPNLSEMEALYAQAMEDAAPVESDEGADFATRLAGSFARTDQELKGLLEKRLGKKNVRYRDGEFQVKVNEKWSPYDPSGADLGDIADFGRDVAEEVISAPVTAAGVMLSGGTGFVPARMAGNVAGNELADLYAEKVIGIERDPNRNKTRETLFSAALGGSAGKIEAGLAKLTADRALRLGDKALAPGKFVEKRIEEMKQVTESLAEEGLIQPIPGTGRYLTPTHMDYKNPEAKGVLKWLSTEQPIRDALDFLGESAIESMEKFTNRLGNMQAKAAGKGKQFIGELNDVLGAEGNLIGSFRKSFKEQAGDGVVRVNSLNEKVGKLAEDLGVYRKDDTLVIPAVEDLINNGYGTDPKQTEIFRNLMQDMFEQVYNNKGEVSAGQLDALYERLKRFADNAARNNDMSSFQKKAYWDLRKAIGDDYTTGIGAILGEKGPYGEALGRYKDLKNASEALGSMLENDGLTISGIGKKIFSGDTAPGRIEAVKTYLKDKPEVWEDIKGAYLKQLSDEASSMTNSGLKIDPVKFYEKVKKLSPETKLALFENAKGGEKVFDDLARYAKVIQSTDIESLPTPKRLGLARRMIGILGSPFMQAKFGFDTVTDIISRLDKPEAVVEFLGPAGEEILKSKPKELSRWLKFIDGVRAGMEKGVSSPVTSPVMRGMLKQPLDQTGEGDLAE